jgi:hypothetical protein
MTQSPPRNAAPASPPADLSPRVLQLVRKIDHLPAGQYTIELVKHSAPAEWNITIRPATVDNAVN